MNVFFVWYDFMLKEIFTFLGASEEQIANLMMGKPEKLNTFPRAM